MPQIDEYRKNIGFQGGLSFLICSITGPGVIMIPAVFQKAGWFFPVVIFALVAFLSGMSCLFLIEAMTYFPGNKYFERNVEFTVLVHHFYGKTWYYIMHIILYGSLQSFNIASIISAVQNFDTFLLSAFGGTCGYGLGPISGIYCVTTQTDSSSPFGSNYMLITTGGILFAILIIPLMNLNIDDNMIFQWISLIYLYFAVFIWILFSFMQGLHPGWVPAVGANFFSAPTSVIGQVLFNFTLANTVPSWHKSVSIQKCIWWSVGIVSGLYCATGLFGGLAFQVGDGSNLLSAMASVLPEGSAAAGLLNFITLTFPILVLLTSIPVSFIIVRLNLITSRLCTKDQATFFGSILPFLICIPFQTGPFLVVFTNWSSLIFQSLCNFIAPFLIYIYLDKRNLVMQQSVIDELENLDLDGAIRKRVTDDDDFDYVYHLPHADLTRLGPNRYDPFAKMDLTNNDDKKGQIGAAPKIQVPGMISASSTSLRSRTKIKILDMDDQPDPHKQLRHQHGGGGHMGMGSHLSLSGGGGGGLSVGGRTSRKGSFIAMHGSSIMIGANTSHAGSNTHHGSQNFMVPDISGNNSNAGLRGVDRRFSMQSGASKGSKVNPEGAGMDYRFGNTTTASQSFVDVDDPMNIPREDDQGPSFKALPEWVTRRVSSRTVAILCFFITVVLTVSVLLYPILMLAIYHIDVVDS